MTSGELKSKVDRVWTRSGATTAVSSSRWGRDDGDLTSND
jgi:hypothetical protein